MQVLVKRLITKIKDEAKGQGLESNQLQKSWGKKKKLGNC